MSRTLPPIGCPKAQSELRRPTCRQVIAFGLMSILSIGLAHALVPKPLMAASQALAAPSPTKSLPLATAASGAKPDNETGNPEKAKEAPRLTFGPTYLPREVELSREQVEAVRAVVVNQVKEYHQSLVEQNRVAGAKHQLWLANTKVAYENDQWNRLHTQKVLERHAFFSVVIFWVVIAVLAIALLLTIHQFLRDSTNAELVMRKILRKRAMNHVLERGAAI